MLYVIYVASVRLLDLAQEILYQPNRLQRLLSMHPVARIKHLQSHVREVLLRDGYVFAVDVL